MEQTSNLHTEACEEFYAVSSVNTPKEAAAHRVPIQKQFPGHPSEKTNARAALEQ